jgi:hypothetical protein
MLDQCGAGGIEVQDYGHGSPDGWGPASVAVRREAAEEAGTVDRNLLDAIRPGQVLTYLDSTASGFEPGARFHLKLGVPRNMMLEPSGHDIAGLR